MYPGQRAWLGGFHSFNTIVDPHKQCVCLCSKYKEMYWRILKSLNIVNLYRGMSKLKLKIYVKVPQLLCIVVFVALNSRGVQILLRKRYKVAKKYAKKLLKSCSNLKKLLKNFVKLLEYF